VEEDDADSIWQRIGRRAQHALGVTSPPPADAEAGASDRPPRANPENQTLTTSEAHFRNLAALPSAWYWEMNKDLQFTEVTEPSSPRRGIKSSEMLGLSRWDLPGAAPTPLERSLIDKAVATRKPYRDLGYHVIAQDGSSLYVQSSGDPIFDSNGLFAGFRGTSRDATASHRADELLRLLQTIQRLLAEADLASSAMQVVVRALCEIENWQLGRYFRLDPVAHLLYLDAHWDLADPNALPAGAGSESVSLSSGEGLMATVLRSGNPLWCSDASTDERLGALSDAKWFDMRATLIFPVQAVGRNMGVLALTSNDVRMPEDRVLFAMRIIGEQIGQYLLREEIEASLRNSERRFRNLTALSADWYWEVDAQLRFIDIATSISHLWGKSGTAMIGLNRWDIEGANPSDEDRMAIDQATAARRPYRDLGYEVIASNGDRRYVETSGDPIHNANGEFTGYRGIGKDVTEQRRADQILQIEHAIALSLAAADDTGTAVRKILKTFCESENWDLGRYFGLDEASGILRLKESWCKPMVAVEKFLKNSAGNTFAPNHGLVGRAWTSDEPVWSENALADQRFIYAQDFAAAGLHGAFGFRAHVTGKALGVFMFNSHEIRTPDVRLLRATRVIGGQIGVFVARQNQMDHVGRLNRIYRVLSGINSLIVRVQGREELFREACRIAVDDGQFMLAWIGLVDASSRKIGMAAAAGDMTDYIDQIGASLRESAADAVSACGVAIATGEAVIVNDITKAPAHPLKDQALGLGFRSLCALPLKIGSANIGSFCLYADSTEFFDSDEMKLLLELAGDVSFALDHLEKAERLQYLAYYDGLTGLANRTLFAERLNQFVAEAGRAGEKLAVLIYDVARFKDVNDTFGRQAGDDLLKQITERALTLVDATWIGRMDGDRFASIRPRFDSDVDVDQVMTERMRLIFGKPFRVGHTEMRVTAKVGVAVYPSDASDAETLFKNAEIALKRAKLSGERYLFFNPRMAVRVAEKIELENRLQQAVENHEFVLHYQPKVDLATGDIVGLEALIRWQSPDLGLVPPLQFIPLLEENGLILEAGRWALQQAVRDYRQLAMKMQAPPRISVNVSPLQLRREDFVESVRSAVVLDGNVSGIDLEITESILMENIEDIIPKLHELRELGVSVAIDDFGTGYSSLAYLARLPIQVIKIDRSFVATMLENRDTMTLVSTVISLSHSLRLQVIAEGVELEEQAKILRLLHCDQMQGYLFSKPVPFDQLAALLKSS
jgi:diguanylate cyclase (GGDEF)-like protein/PAS domain S-box-containing protein